MSITEAKAQLAELAAQVAGVRCVERGGLLGKARAAVIGAGN
ncbi:hypothetical protein [Streptomyces sp. NPDC091209]